MTVYPLDAAERLHQRLTDDSVCVGVNISITEPTITEIICGAGYDFLWIDAEHSSIDLPVLNNHIRAAAITQTPVVVRVQWNHPGLVKAVLDMGATGVLFPLAKTVADVEQAIAACKYPPEGMRGYGPLRANAYGRQSADYLARANSAIQPWIMVEQIELIDHIEEIVKVPGIAAFYVGWNDLAGSMGLPGQRNHPDVIGAVERFVDTAVAAGIPVVMGAPSDEALFNNMIAKGVRNFTGGGDVTFLASMADQRIQYVREYVAGKVGS